MLFRSAKAAEEETDAADGETNKETKSLLGNVLKKSDKGDTVQAPSTLAVKGTVYSTNGTPIGLNETFQASPHHPAYYYGDSHLHGSPGAFGSGTMQSFPAMSRLSATGDPLSEDGPTTASGTTGESAASGNNQNHPEHSMDSLATYNSSYTTRAQTARPLFGDGSTLMATDLEAVSALNILSNSPALKRKHHDHHHHHHRVHRDDGDDDVDEGISTAQPRAKPKSLFATVMGGSDKKKKQRKA